MANDLKWEIKICNLTAIYYFFGFQKKTKFRENKCINKDVIKTAKPNKK